MTRAAQNLTRNPLLIFVMLLVIPIAGTLFSGLIMFDLPGGEVQQLVTFMTMTGMLSSLIAFALYRLGVLEWFRSLRWAVWTTIALMVLMIFLNVWVIARFTFREQHYLALTSVLLVFAGLSALTIGFFASKTMTDRLSKLTDATQALAGGDFTTRLNIAGNDEIAQLAATFNSMARSLQEVDEQKRQLEQTRRDLTAWVSHDLRTPLTSMRVMIEAILDGVVQDRDTVHRYLDNSRAEIQHLGRLIDDLFALAQLDVGHLTIDMQQASIKDLISDTLGSMMAKASEHEIMLKGEVRAGYRHDIDGAGQDSARAEQPGGQRHQVYAGGRNRHAARLFGSRRYPHRHPQQRIVYPAGCAAALVRELLSRRRLADAG